MTPAEKEIREADKAYETALLRIGDLVVTEVAAEWAQVTAGNAASIAGASGRIVAIIYLWRARARALSMAHTRLIRGLATGATVQDWQAEDQASSITVQQLRDEFERVLARFSVPRPLRSKLIPPTQEVAVEVIEGLREAEIAKEGPLDKEIRDTVRILGREALEKALEVEKRADPNVIRDKVGNPLAAGAERVALNGARGADFDVVSLDHRRPAYIRVHDPNADDVNPCGWCAMLMSRGPVYKTANSAEFSQGDLYHPGCHCRAQKTWVDNYKTDDRYTLNREFQKAWPEVTKGHAGDEAISVWRKWVRENYPTMKAKGATQEVA